MEYKEKKLLEDLRQDLLEEKALTTILGDHFNIRIEKNGEPNIYELKHYFEEYAILNSMLTMKLANSIKDLDQVIYKEDAEAEDIAGKESKK